MMSRKKRQQKMLKNDKGEKIGEKQRDNKTLL